jgi:hypothetical protein
MALSVVFLRRGRGEGLYRGKFCWGHRLRAWGEREDLNTREKAGNRHEPAFQRARFPTHSYRVRICAIRSGDSGEHWRDSSPDRSERAEAGFGFAAAAAAVVAAAAAAGSAAAGCSAEDPATWKSAEKRAGSIPQLLMRPNTSNVGLVGLKRLVQLLHGTRETQPATNKLPISCQICETNQFCRTTPQNAYTS